MQSIFDFTNYRNYLKAYFEERKLSKRKFSYRLFANQCGFKSASFLKMVIDGQKKLTTASIASITSGLGLKKKEAAYFETLVLFEQATQQKEKEHYLERLISLRPQTQELALTADQYRYLTDYRLVALRELAATQDFSSDPHWLAGRFSPALKVSEVTAMLDLLLRLGLLVKKKGGGLAHADASLKTPVEVSALETYYYHLEMLTLAKKALLSVPPLERDMSAITVPMSLKHLKAIKEKVAAFRTELIDYINQDGPPYDDVYQLNIQLFPITTRAIQRSKGGRP